MRRLLTGIAVVAAAVALSAPASDRTRPAWSPPR